MSFKKCKLVMLPTNEKANLYLHKTKGLCLLASVRHQQGTYNGSNQHLYILSNDTIKEGDWIVANQGVHKVTDIKDGKYPYGTLNYKGDKIYHHKSWKKIIATTDKSLKVFIHTTMVIDMDDCYESLPQPSQSFIEKFVEEYNKGNVITEVMVEYEEPYSKLVGSKIGSNIHEFNLEI